jgi:uroporphyrin-3 C-methyltransferase
VDVDGLSATLSTALASVDALPVAGSRYQPVEQTETAYVETGTTAHTLEELGQVVWAALSDLFRLREHDKPVRPMLPPEREYFLRENLRLQLAAARLALLRNDQVQYQSALKTTDGWLTAYFDTETPAVQQLDKQLRDIAVVDIAPALPDVSNSLRRLRQQMQLSEQQAVLPVVPETLPADSKPDSISEQNKEAGATP